MGNRSFRKLRVPNHVIVLIRNLHPHLKRKNGASLETILADPYSGKALKAELSGLWSFRVGRFRIIYRISIRQVELVAIGPRERIYQETFQLISKQGGGE